MIAHFPGKTVQVFEYKVDEFKLVLWDQTSPPSEMSLKKF